MSKLENIYLMNVLLYFPTFRDVLHFIKINKKCHSCVNSLKVNPKFQNEKSILSFLRHFQPDTINFNSIPTKMNRTLFDIIENHLIRNPNFSIPEDEYAEYETSLIKIFENITILNLFEQNDVKMIPNPNNPLDSFVADYIKSKIEIKNFCQLCIENAHHFCKLEKIIGSSEHLSQFFFNYTEGKKVMNVPMPKLVIVNELNENINDVMTSVDALHDVFFTITDKMRENIDELINLFKNSERTKVVFMMREHLKQSEENKELLKKMYNQGRYEYYHKGYKENSCEFLRENYLCREGAITIGQQLGNDDINCIIEKSCCRQVNYRMELFSMNNDKKATKKIWNLPNCVKHLEILDYPLHTSEKPREVLMINLLSLEKLVFSSYSNFIISQLLPNMRHLKILQSCNFQIGKKVKECLKNLEILEMVFCDNVMVFTFSEKLKILNLFGVTNSEFIGTISSIKELRMKECENVTLPFCTFQNKHVYIEMSEKIKFLNSNLKKLSPIQYLGIGVEMFNKIILDKIELPYIPIDLTNRKKMHALRRMYIDSPYVEIINYKPSNQLTISSNTSKEQNILSKSSNIQNNSFEGIHRLIKKNGFELTSRLIELYCHDFFDSSKNDGAYMTIIHKNKPITIPGIIRYIEFHCSGYSILSIGVCEQTAKFETNFIGQVEGSIGVKSDDGRVYCGKAIGEEFTESFGMNEEESHYFGVGLDCHKMEVFFTKDGKKLDRNFMFIFDVVNVGVTILDFDWLEINYGDRDFEFDLIGMYKERGYSLK